MLFTTTTTINPMLFTTTTPAPTTTMPPPPPPPPPAPEAPAPTTPPPAPTLAPDHCLNGTVVSDDPACADDPAAKLVRRLQASVTESITHAAQEAVQSVQ